MGNLALIVKEQPKHRSMFRLKSAYIIERVTRTHALLRHRSGVLSHVRLSDVEVLEVSSICASR
jgi:hypothetical protein